MSHDGGDDGDCDLLLSSYYCTPLRPLWPVSANPKRLSLPKVILANICVNRMASRLEENIRRYAQGETEQFE
jgi:hypothetical protein